MPDWERLGQHVVARRTELGFRNRAAFAAAVQLSSRLISDIEKSRRTNFDQVTLSALEAALGWETGSVMRIVDGGDPQLRPGAPGAPGIPGQRVAGRSAQTDEIELIAESRTLTARQKLELIRLVLRLRAQAEAETAAARGAAERATTTDEKASA